MIRRGVFRSVDFTKLFVATFVSAASVSIARFAIPLVAVVALGADELEVGLVSTFLTLPFLLVGLPAGVWVDRLRRRGILIFCQFARAAILASIPLSWWAGVLSIWQLYAAVLLFGVGNVFYDVAYQSYLPNLVGRENLLEANAKLTGVQQVFAVGGPSFAGQVVALLTAPVSFVVTSVGLAIAPVFIAHIRAVEPKRAGGATTRMLPEISAGLRYVRRDARLLAMAGATAWLNLTAYAAYTATILFLARTLALSAAGIGLFLSVTGLGGLIGSLIGRRLASRFGLGPTMWLILLAGSPFALLLPNVGTNLLWLGAIANGVVAFMAIVYNVTEVSCTQLLTPDELLGRVNATMRFLTWSAMPPGGPGGSHPRAPTERNVTVSRHSALLVHPSELGHPCPVDEETRFSP